MNIKDEGDEMVMHIIFFWAGLLLIIIGPASCTMGMINGWNTESCEPQRVITRVNVSYRVGCWLAKPYEGSK